MSTATRTPEEQTQFDCGYDLGWREYEPGERTAVPVGVDFYFGLGYWCGVGDARAFHQGWDAAKCGLRACPYAVDADDECFRDAWLAGYGDALRGFKTEKIAGHA